VHFSAARKRLRREHNNRMTQAFYTALLPNMKTPPKLKDLLVDVDAKPRGKQSWQEMKAVLMAAMPPEPKE
jgi:hypothetical protein